MIVIVPSPSTFGIPPSKEVIIEMKIKRCIDAGRENRSIVSSALAAGMGLPGDGTVRRWGAIYLHIHLSRGVILQGAENARPLSRGDMKLPKPPSRLCGAIPILYGIEGDKFNLQFAMCEYWRLSYIGNKR